MKFLNMTYLKLKNILKNIFKDLMIKKNNKIKDTVKSHNYCILKTVF